MGGKSRCWLMSTLTTRIGFSWPVKREAFISLSSSRQNGGTTTLSLRYMCLFVYVKLIVYYRNLLFFEEEFFALYEIFIKKIFLKQLIYST